MDTYTIRLSARICFQTDGMEFFQKTNEGEHRRFINDLSSELRFFTECLASQEWISVKKLLDEFEQAGFSEASCFLSMVKLAACGLLQFAVFEMGTCLIRMEVMQPPLIVKKISLDDPREWKLSRFAYIHSVEEGFLLETPLGFGKLWLDDTRVLSLLNSIRNPQTLDVLLEKHAELSEEALVGIIGLLETAQVIWPVERGYIWEEQDETLQLWEFHDACFHGRSRMGRHNYPSGGTYRFRGKIASLPDLKTQIEGKKILLSPPNPMKFLQDPPHQQVVEQRYSSRFPSKKKLTIAHISEFFYRTIRLRGPSSKKTNPPYARLYPSGGALYELEFYILVHECQEVEAGLYYYSPKEHALIQLNAEQELRERLLRDSKTSMSVDFYPAVLLILSARFGRMNWKYESISYAAILKHVGIVFHAFYLAASAMGLAVCANGSGNSEIFSNLINADFFSEGSVGEFALMGFIDPDNPMS